MQARRSQQRPGSGYAAEAGKLLALVGALAACALTICLMDPALAPGDPGVAEATTPAPWPLLALNLVPLLLILLLLVAVTGRAWLSTLLLAGMTYLLYFVNQIKLAEQSTPIVPADFQLLLHLDAKGALLLARYLPHGRLTLAIGLAVLAIIALLWWKERPLNLLRGKRRLIVIALALMANLSLLRGWAPWPVLYGEDVPLKVWAPKLQALESGLLANLLHYQWAMGVILPAPDDAAASALLARHRDLLTQTPAMPPADLPDIIVLQSESLFDPSRLNGIESAQVLPHLRELAQSAQHGDMWAPTFGGGTIRTEFEVLTGIAMRYFPLVEYPYFGMAATRETSLASVLARHGYETLAVHPYHRSFWNRASALANLGFADFDAEDEFGDAPRQGWYISDDALVDHLLARLSQATSPMFVFAISMENHGPYDDYPNVDTQRLQALKLPPQLDEHGSKLLRGYLYHLDNADRALARLVDGLRQRPRRSLLLFYGDHLPGLNEVYDQLGFRNGAAATQQPVPWLLLDTAHPAPQAAQATAAFYLPGKLLATAGIDDEPYFRLLESLGEADHVGPGWSPPDDAQLAAVMQLRQQREFARLLRQTFGARPTVAQPPAAAPGER